MRSLELPLRNEHADLQACIERRAPRARAVLERLLGVVHDAYSRYEDVVLGDDLPATIDSSDAQVLRDTFRLLDAGRPMAQLRRDLLSIGSNDRCPMCDRVPVSALDHHLPKSSFPHYSVMPRNLVPICDRCNRAKRDALRTSRSSRFFHPYYDATSSTQLLDVSVEIEPILYIKFGIRRDGPDREIAEVMHFTLTQLGLDRYYEGEAYDDLGDLSGSLENSFQAAGGPGVRAHLLGIQESCSTQKGPNYWRSALYGSLAEHQGFCEGGYRQLLPE